LRRAAVIAFVLAVLAGFGWLVKTAAGDAREVAYSPGVAPNSPVAKLQPGERVCQEPIDIPVKVASVVFPVSTAGARGVPLDVTLRTPSGRVLGRGRLAGGYPDLVPQVTRLDREAGPYARAAICVANRGDARVTMLGSENVTSSHTVQDGAINQADLDVWFLYRKPRSFLSLIPDTFERAALFRPGWVGPWTFWALLGLLAIAAPLLLGFALWRAIGDDALAYGEPASTQSSRRPQSDDALAAGTRSSARSPTGSSTTAS
jgi:hypothetical protein